MGSLCVTAPSARGLLAVSSGSTGTPTISSPPYGHFAYREWSGGDGKYELHSGSVRAKWNSLTFQKRDSSVSGNIGFLCPMGHVVQYQVQAAPWWGTCGMRNTTDSQNLDRLNKLLGKIKGHSFNAGVSLSQTNQLVSMVSGNLGKLGRSIMALKRGDFTTAARQLGAAPKPSKLKSPDVSGRWLELQYGWLPALADTYEAAKAFESISAGPRAMQFSASTRDKASRNFDSSTFGGDRYTVKAEFSRTYTVEVYEELGFARQLGLLDPLSILWENIPYSFVVDWFVPIGDYLSVLNQIPKINGRWMVTDYTAWRGTKYQWRPGVSLPFCPTHAGQQFTQLVQTPTVVYTEKRCVRDSVGGSIQIPTPNVRVLGAVHGRRIANAIALAAQRFLS